MLSEICLELFTRSSIVLKNEHNERVNKPVGFEYTFPDCGKVMSRKDHLKRLYNQADRGLKILCDIEGCKNYLERVLKTHIMSCHKKKEFKCDLDNCAKKFKHKDNLLCRQVKDHEQLQGNAVSIVSL